MEEARIFRGHSFTIIVQTSFARRMLITLAWQRGSSLRFYHDGVNEPIYWRALRRNYRFNVITYQGTTVIMQNDFLGWHATKMPMQIGKTRLVVFEFRFVSWYAQIISPRHLKISITIATYPYEFFPPSVERK